MAHPTGFLATGSMRGWQHGGEARPSSRRTRPPKCWGSRARRSEQPRRRDDSRSPWQPSIAESVRGTDSTKSSYARTLQRFRSASTRVTPSAHSTPTAAARSMPRSSRHRAAIRHGRARGSLLPCAGSPKSEEHRRPGTSRWRAARGPAPRPGRSATGPGSPAMREETALPPRRARAAGARGEGGPMETPARHWRSVPRPAAPGTCAKRAPPSKEHRAHRAK